VVVVERRKRAARQVVALGRQPRRVVASGSHPRRVVVSGSQPRLVVASGSQARRAHFPARRVVVSGSQARRVAQDRWGGRRKLMQRLLISRRLVVEGRAEERLVRLAGRAVERSLEHLLVRPAEWA
jgi:hypothetical protein